MYREESVGRLFRRGVRGTLSPDPRDARVRRGAVMTVRNVAARDFAECRLETGHFGGIVDDPQRVADAVGRDEVGGRPAAGHLTDERVDRGEATVGQEDRPRVGSDRVRVPGAVVLLIGPRVLVLLDPP